MNGLIVFSILLLSATASASSLASDDTLAQVIAATTSNSERLLSSKMSEKIAELKTALADTGYMPDINAEAIDSTGFSGSTGLLGVGGIMGSPYRSGYGYGLVATQPIFDFGKTSRLRASAEALAAAARKDTELVRVDVMRGAIDAYVQCALAQSEIENWSAINQESGVLAREISKYVSTGQRSVVEDSLARGQHDEASRTQATFEKRLEVMKRRLAILTGWPTEKVACRPIEEVAAKAPDESPGSPTVILKAEAQLRLSEADLRAARAGYLPRIVGLASVGNVEDARVVQKTQYALGVGVIIPLFDSGRTNVEVDRAKVSIEKSSHDLKAAHQEIDSSNAQYDDQIQAAETELEFLKVDLGDAEKALQQAKKRYANMSGTLVDLRESVRNLSKVKAEISEYRAQLVRMTWLKAIVNGRFVGAD